MGNEHSSSGTERKSAGMHNNRAAAAHRGKRSRIGGSPSVGAMPTQHARVTEPRRIKNTTGNPLHGFVARPCVFGLRGSARWSRRRGGPRTARRCGEEETKMQVNAVMNALADAAKEEDIRLTKIRVEKVLSFSDQ